MLSPLALPLLAGSGLLAAWLDAKVRRLPNLLTAAVGVLGLTVTTSHAGASAAGSAALHSAIALVVGLALYSRGIIGGGDVKYYGGVAAWFPMADGFRLLGFVSLAGLGVVAAWCVWHRHARRTDRAVGASDHDKVPFGIAIAAGALLAAAAS